MSIKKFHWLIFIGFSTKIYAIDNGRVSADLRNPNLNNNLPIIPTEVSIVNFTWKSGNKKYTYHFDKLQSTDESILKSPTVSIATGGNVPQEAKGLHKLFRFTQRSLLLSSSSDIVNFERKRFVFYHSEQKCSTRLIMLKIFLGQLVFWISQEVKIY